LHSPQARLEHSPWCLGHAIDTICIDANIDSPDLSVAISNRASRTGAVGKSAVTVGRFD